MVVGRVSTWKGASLFGRKGRCARARASLGVPSGSTNAVQEQCLVPVIVYAGRVVGIFYSTNSRSRARGWRGRGSETAAHVPTVEAAAHVALVKALVVSLVVPASLRSQLALSFKRVRGGGHTSDSRLHSPAIETEISVT